MASSSPITATASPPRRWSRRRVLFLLTWLVFLAVLVELASRAFLAASAGILRPGNMVYVYYPELKPVLSADIARDDGYFDVLLLGGSVIDKRWTDIDAVLQRRLSLALRRPVRTHNLGARSHTSRDSFFKYRHLRGVAFDLVVVYHGINEARLNHCPAEMFRPDYSHYRWYAQVNRLEAHRELRFLAIPYVLDSMISGIIGRLRGFEYAPEGSPPQQWLQHGKNVKTAGPFRDNLAAILDLAKSKGETVVLPSFAYYVAPGYSRQRFRDRELDYDRHQTPIEVWGTPETVVGGIATHNRITRELAAQYDNALFVDQAAFMPTGKEYYQDICHLTHAGAQQFVEHLLQALVPTLQLQRRPPTS